MNQQRFYPDVTEQYPGLMDAIFQKSYPRIYQELSRHTGAFSPNAALSLLLAALDNHLAIEAFEAVLKRCPPVPEFISCRALQYEQVGSGGPMEIAAYLDRADVLALLLEWGASPNMTSNHTLSPLNAALRGRSLCSVKLLMEQPDLDTAWTPRLLDGWARLNASHPKERACLEAMAPRFTGWEPHSGQPLPIPGPMTLEIIAWARNGPLPERFCRERGPISKTEGLNVLRELNRLSQILCWGDRTVEGEEQSAFAGTLTALLKSCPDLLRTKRARRVLLRGFLYFDGEAQARLRPWADRLGRRQISMEAEDWHYMGYDGFLARWRKLLPHGPNLVLDRWSDVFEYLCLCDMPAKTAGRILSACPIRGGQRKEKLSPVAQEVLNYGDPPLIESIFQQPRGLLKTEDPDALTAYVQGNNCPRTNRAAVLARVRRKTDYDL